MKSFLTTPQMCHLLHRLHLVEDSDLPSLVYRVLLSTGGTVTRKTPEERAFPLAVEYGDAAVAGRTLERMIGRGLQSLTLTLRGHWLRCARALARKDYEALRTALGDVLTYHCSGSGTIPTSRLKVS